MIISVNPNTCIDRTLVVPEFSLNRTIRASLFALGMGGKAADASWILGEYGIPRLALGFAAGAPGKLMMEMLQKKGVTTDFTPVDGETRVHTVIVMEDGSGQSTFTVPSLIVRPEHIIDLDERYERALGSATCVVIGGTLPTGIPEIWYSSLVSRAVEKGIPVIMDASGPYLAAGLNGHPTLIKPNRIELEELAGHPLFTMEDVIVAGGEIREQFGCSLVVTLGGEGSLALLPNRAYRIPAVDVKIASTAGAGDGMLAGLAAAISAGWPLEEGLRLGTAMAGAVCMQLATADCRRVDIEYLLHQVEFQPLDK